MSAKKSTAGAGEETGRRGAPDKPVLEGLEVAWAERWADEGTYHFDPTATRERVYSIDPPLPL
jgi:valyl-tRNA synthetase